MTTQELSAQLGKIQSALQTDMPKWLDASLGNTALYFIRDRVINRGEAAEGNFKPYSTKPMLVGASSFRTKAQASSYFGGKGKAGKTKRAAMEWRSLPGDKPTYSPEGFYSSYRRLAVLPGGYKELRNLVGAESGFKNFTFTGEMWGGTHYQPTDKPIDRSAFIKGLGTKENGNLKWTTTVGSKSELTNKKLQGHADREGKEILQLSKKEESDLLAMLNERVKNVIEKAING